MLFYIFQLQFKTKNIITFFDFELTGSLPRRGKVYLQIEIVCMQLLEIIVINFRYFLEL